MSAAIDTTEPTTNLQDEYDRLYAELMEAHQPRNAHERILVEEFIDACWDLKAARRVSREFWCCVGDHYRPGPAGVAEAQFQEKEARFRSHLRYRADAERSYYRALEALNALTRRSSARPPRIAAAPVSVGQSGASTPAAAPRARSHSAGQTEAAAPLPEAVVHVPVPSSSPAPPRPESPSARLRLVNGSCPTPSRGRGDG